MSASNAAAAAVAPVAEDGASLSTDTTPKQYARRRTMLVVEKRINADGVGNGTVDGKDLSHTIRGESVVERMKTHSTMKKGFISPSIVSPRRKKVVQKSEKPRWQTVLSVLTKNFLLLAFLLWFGQNVWRWSHKTHNRPENVDSPLIALDIGIKISEVEASVERTTKMLQVQLDILDKKIGSEIGTATRDLLKQAEEKGALFEEELKKLEAKADSLDKSIGALKGMDLVTREDFEKLVNEWNSKSIEVTNRKLDLDQIRAIARDIVKKEIKKHAADGLGRVDYALASGGAKVVRHSEPHVLGKANSWISSSMAIAKGRNGVHASAYKMLEPSFGEPGQCFPLQGSSGFVEIKLRTAIIPEAVTLEHVSESVAYDRSSAPKDCRVSAWLDSTTEDSSSNVKKVYLLTEFSYDLEKNNAQTFNANTGDSGVVNMIRLDFSSNHGSPALTCIYRFRVHGYEPSSPATMAL